MRGNWFWFGLGVVAGMVLMMVLTSKHPTPDQLYGCTIKQQLPNADCP